MMELSFFIVFTAEFVLRVTMHYQFKKTTITGVWLHVFPGMLFAMKPTDVIGIIRYVPVFLAADAYACFDVMLLLLATVDNFILRFFFTSLKFLYILRLFRALRMLRMMKIMYLC